jgi:hypothetical protein
MAGNLVHFLNLIYTLFEADKDAANCHNYYRPGTEGTECCQHIYLTSNTCSERRGALLKGTENKSLLKKSLQQLLYTAG